jgi:DNA-binding IclR family transcriptional regulator
LKILELLLDHPGGLQQTEIATRLSCSKTSVYRISLTLMAYGYVTRDEETKVIRLSRKLLAMGTRTLAEEDLLGLSQDLMKSLRDQVKETVLIGTAIETELVVLGQVLGSHHFKFSIDLGTRIPLHSSAPGKALLAWLPPKEREQLLKVLPYTRFNERTICSAEELSRELETILADGYAVDRGEQMSGIHCVAAPILNSHGYPLASVWTTGPNDRLRNGCFPKVGELVCEHARAISERLGYGVLSPNGNQKHLNESP